MAAKQESPLLNIGCNVVIPSIIMTKFSDEAWLGQVWGLIIALLFPLVYGLWDWFRLKKLNFFSGIGLFSILLTGVIGLGKLDRNWMIVKETAIPLIFGIVVIAFELWGRSLVRLFFEQIIDLKKIDAAFKEKGDHTTLNKTLSRASYMLGGTFFISAILNFVLAVYILEGSPGSVEFNKSLGKMTALSFPVISLPLMIITGLILWSFFRVITQKTHLTMETLIKR